MEYNRQMVEQMVFKPEVRNLSDSMKEQKIQFATLSAKVAMTEETKKEKVDDLQTDEIRSRMPVEEENQFKKMKNELKEYNFIVTDDKKLEKKGPQQDNTMKH